MGVVATTVFTLAIAGAVASWVVGAVYFARCLAAIEGQDAGAARWAAVVAWPFALKRLKGAAAEHAAVVNKAIIVFLVCLTAAALTISLSTNYTRIAK
jgi:hypothetical protein